MVLSLKVDPPHLVVRYISDILFGLGFEMVRCFGVVDPDPAHLVVKPLQDQVELQVNVHARCAWIKHGLY